MEEKPYRIDVHNHVVYPEYLEELKTIGVTKSLGKSFVEWSTDTTLEVMDRNNIKIAVTSVSSPGVYFGDAAFAKRVARLCNDLSAGLISDHPSRFGAFAFLPLPDVPSSLDELSYSCDSLHLDGIAVLSHSGGIYIGDDRYHELYEEFDRRKSVVYVHPTEPASGNPLGQEIPAFLMEVTFETARVIFNLLYKGVLERYPNIHWIFAHAGGALPYLTWRISLGQFVLPGAGEAVPQGVPYYLKRYYYDTGLSANPYVFRTLRELVEPGQILFGTDYPFAPEILTADTIKGLQAYDGFTETDLRQIEFENTLNLFPRLKQV